MHLARIEGSWRRTYTKVDLNLPSGAIIQTGESAES